MVAAAASLEEYNLGLIADAVPAKVFIQNGLDYDRCFPLPRRLMAAARLMLALKRDRTHYKRTLDTITERFDVRCGPLVNARIPGTWSA